MEDRNHVLYKTFPSFQNQREGKKKRHFNREEKNNASEYTNLLKCSVHEGLSITKLILGQERIPDSRAHV